MDSRCRRRSRRPVFTATLENRAEPRHAAGVHPLDRRREVLLRHSEEGSEIGAHGASFGDRLLEDEREELASREPLEVPREVRAVEAHLECSRPRSDELLERSSEVAPLEDEPVLGVRPIDRMPEHDEELRRRKHIPDPIGAHGVVQVLGGDLSDRPVPGRFVGGTEEPLVPVGTMLEVAVEESHLLPTGREIHLRMPLQQRVEPGRSRLEERRSRRTSGASSSGTSDQDRSGRQLLGGAPCRAQRRAGRGIDPRVRAGAPRPR